MEHESQDSILTNLPPRIQHLLGANLKDLIMPANPLPPFQGLVNRNTNAIALNDRQHLLSACVLGTGLNTSLIPFCQPTER